jgi:branched-chain amino acid transport system ATP-binding protein
MNETLVMTDVDAFYGSSQILRGVSLSLAPGEVLCLLGLNGMGKTTTLRSIMGLVDRTNGLIAMGDRPLTGTTFQRARRGVTLVPEANRDFSTTTYSRCSHVLPNVCLNWPAP